MRELDVVVLTTELPDHGLQAGDIGTVVLRHRGGAGYEVEFATLGGETVAVATLLPPHLRLVARGGIAHARPVSSARSGG